MHVISQKMLREFWAEYPDSCGPLKTWHRKVEHELWSCFAEVKKFANSTDQVGKFTVFDIGGNKYRVIAVIHYNREKVYLRHVLTHKEYQKGKWKKD